jgi:NAD(P)-dependent dehydrogenase (short-subunit alcohol dehydrogenase family)
MTKGALGSLTNVMALDHGREIRVNAVHPGVTLTRQVLRDALAEGISWHSRFADRVPMGHDDRMGWPDKARATMDRFAERFAAAAFRRDSFIDLATGRRTDAVFRS